ncbi:unnamed protein product, partial [Allacma fusca]
KLEAWKAIAESVIKDPNSTEDLHAIQHMWKELVKQYTGYLLKMSKIPTGAGAKDYPTPIFRHSALMEFYKPNYKPYKRREIVSNFESPETPESISDEDDEFTGPTVLFPEKDITDFVVLEQAAHCSTQKGRENASSKVPKRKRQGGDLDEEFLNLYKKRLSEEDEFHHF